MALFKKTTIFIFLTLLIGLKFNSLFPQSLANKINTIVLREFKDNNGPGGVFMLAKNGKVPYQKAFGKANIELDVNLTTENVFQIGSITC